MLPALLLTVTSCRNLWRRVLWRSSMLVFFSSVCFYFVTTSWIAEIGSSSLVLILPQKYSFIGTIWSLGQLRHTVHNYDSLSRLLRGQLLKEGSCWKRAAVESGVTFQLSFVDSSTLWELLLYHGSGNNRGHKAVRKERRLEAILFQTHSNLHFLGSPDRNFEETIGHRETAPTYYIVIIPNSEAWAKL